MSVTAFPATVPTQPDVRVIVMSEAGPAGAVPVDGVGVWLLDPSPGRAAAVASALTPDEAARASRARRGSGEKFTAVRGTLRQLLGHELGVAPREVPIVYGDHGKPAIDPALGSDLGFNVSHTGGLAAIAVAHGREVGVDVELRRPRRRLDLLARATLTAGERARFDLVPRSEQLGAFLDAWSAKEAYSKLLGRGVGIGFDALELDEVRSRVARLPLPPSHSGALAA